VFTTILKKYVGKPNDQICVLSSRKILCYDFDGILISTIELNVGSDNMAILDKEKFMINNLGTRSIPSKK